MNPQKRSPTFCTRKQHPTGRKVNNYLRGGRLVVGAGDKAEALAVNSHDLDIGVGFEILAQFRDEHIHAADAMRGLAVRYQDRVQSGGKVSNFRRRKVGY